MDPERLRMLIVRLINSTRAGKLVWEATADEDTYRLTLNVGMVHIQRVKPQAANVTFVGAPDAYRFSLFNPDNLLVAAFEGGQANEPLDYTLRELYEAARDAVLKPSEFFREVEQEVIRRSG